MQSELKRLVEWAESQNPGVTFTGDHPIAMARAALEKPGAAVEAPVPAKDLWALLPGSAVYLDPPDGGDVPLLEQLRRMSEDARRYRHLRAQEWHTGPMLAVVAEPKHVVRLGAYMPSSELLDRIVDADERGENIYDVE